MMSSTREITDAVMLAQQYNIHIYRTLMNGLVESSTKVSQLKAEFEEYSRSNLEFFDRLHQIQNSKIPFVCVREEQIRVVRDQVKRNDRLRQEVHSVQRNLWNMRMMGQKIPMTKRHLIKQGYPELCATTRSDQVPLTVFCDHVMHKYNLHNERQIVAMIKWCEEEINTQRTTNPVPKRVQKRSQSFPTLRPSKVVGEPVEQEIRLQDIPPVYSKKDIHQQTDGGFAMKLDDIKELDVLFQVLGVEASVATKTNAENVPHGDTPIKPAEEISYQSTDDTCITMLSFNDIIDLDDQTTNEVKEHTDKSLMDEEIPSLPRERFTSQHGDTPIKPAEEVGSQSTDDTCITMLSFNDIVDLDDQTANEVKQHTDKSLMDEEIPSLPGERFTSQHDVVHDLLSIIQNIPEFGATSVSTKSDGDKCFQEEHKQDKVCNNQTGISTEFEAPVKAVTEVTKYNLEPTAPSTKQSMDENKRRHHIQYDPRCRQEPLCSWDELIKRFTKPEKPKNGTKDVLPTEHRADVVEKSSPTAAPTSPQLTQNTAVSDEVNEKCEVVNRVPNTNQMVPQRSVQPETSKVVQKTQTKSSQPCPLDGSDQPCMFETIKRKQHTVKTSYTEKTSSAEAKELKRKREEQLRALELKKQRTKNILNLQCDGKSSKGSESAHQKVVKVQDTGPQVGKVFKTPDSLVQSRPITTQVRPETTTQETKDPLSVNQKRPPASLSVLPPFKRVCQQIKPEIRKQETKVSAFVTRKRPAAPSNPLPASKRACRQKEPRILLRIFKEHSEWNVEQVFD